MHTRMPLATCDCFILLPWQHPIVLYTSVPTCIKTVEVYNCVHQQQYSRSECGHHKCQVHVLKPCNNESNNVACALHSISYHGNIVNLNITKCPTKKTKSIASTHYTNEFYIVQHISMYLQMTIITLFHTWRG